MTAGARLLEAAGHGIERLFSTELEPHLVVAEQFFEQVICAALASLAEELNPPRRKGQAPTYARNAHRCRRRLSAMPQRNGRDQEHSISVEARPGEFRQTYPRRASQRRKIDGLSQSEAVCQQ